MIGVEGEMGDNKNLRATARQSYPIAQDHPWHTAVVPVVAICGDRAVAIGAGFVISSFGLVLTPGVVAATAMQRASTAGGGGQPHDNDAPHIGCVFGKGMTQGFHWGRLVTAEPFFHPHTDFALLQLDPSAVTGTDGLFQMLPLTLQLPVAGTQLVVVGYNDLGNSGQIIDEKRVVYDWQMTAYRTSAAGVAESPRKQGAPSQLVLLNDDSTFDSGMVGGAIFTLDKTSHDLPYDPVCAALGQAVGAGASMSYGMALASAVDLRIPFPEEGKLRSKSLYDICRDGRFTAVHGLDAPATRAAPAAPVAWLHSHGLELGYYSPGKVPVVRYTPTLHSQARPPAMTAVHEKMHMALTTSTAHGTFLSELALIARALEQLHSDVPTHLISSVCDDLVASVQELMTTSWLTQEAGATRLELDYAQLHYEPDVAARLRQDLPEMYAHALATLDVIMATLDFPFPPFAEALRGSVATALCSAALNTDIFDRFTQTPSQTALREYLRDPSNHPDQRLVAIENAAKASPNLLTPLAPALYECVVRFAGALQRASSHEERLQCFGDAGREVDRIVQSYIRDLKLFPVVPWTDLTLQQIQDRRVSLGHSILAAAGVAAAVRPDVTYHEINLRNLPERQAFDGLDHSHQAMRAQNMATFREWLERARSVSLPQDGRLAFAAAPLAVPQAGKEAPGWICYIASLTLAPGLLRFNRQAIELENISASDLGLAIEALHGYPASLAVPHELMQALPEHARRALQGRGIPLFEYVSTVSTEIVDDVIRRLRPPAHARVLADVFEAIQIWSIRSQDPDASRLLWIDSGTGSQTYRSLLGQSQIAIGDHAFDGQDEDDVALLLAAWMCTYGTIGYASSAR